MSYQIKNKPIATAIYNAFQAEPFYLAIARARENQVESEKEVLIKYFDFAIEEAKQYGLFYTLDKQAVGASIWLKPNSPQLNKQQNEAKKSFLKNQFGEKSLAIYQEMAALMNEKEANLVGDDWWYLSILAVAKNQQGKGLGKALMQPILAQTDALGVTTYLETFTEGNLHFYGKLGYEVAVEYFEPLLEKTCWILVRKVK